MEWLIQLADEIDDMLAPLLAMGTAADYWRIVTIVAGAAGAWFTGSALVMVAGVALAAAAGLAAHLPLPAPFQARRATRTR